MTRAYIALLHGDFAKAFYWHPLWWLVPVVAIFVAINFLTDKKVINKWTISIFLILVFGVYIYRMITMFPNVAPMDYDWNSLLGRLIK
jgi:cytochrome bd-type quinol oxidase subunit 2